MRLPACRAQAQRDSPAGEAGVADEADAVVLNIGVRGVLLETARSLELGGKVGLSFHLPGDSVEVGVVGQVVRIASEEAGRRYGLKVLKRDLADQRDNYTRFLIISLARICNPCPINSFHCWRGFDFVELAFRPVAIRAS